MIERNEEQYETLLRSIASLSGLFSQSDTPYIDSRFVEKLFVVTTGAVDLGRADKSFDAFLLPGVGVGVKTFVAGASKHSDEKIAEFTDLANKGHFAKVAKRELVRRVADARNIRVQSNAKEYGVDLTQSVYHCLIRIPGAAVIHEEPYELIDVSNLRPLLKSGQPAESWASMGDGVYFTDGRSKYKYNVAKNVLYKRFHFDSNKNRIDLQIHHDPLSLLDELVGRKSQRQKVSSGFSLQLEIESLGRKGIDYIVLPLYSPKSGVVHPKSGINQWNAGGRQRKFGEAYIPIPIEVRNRYPKFLPAQDTHFDLLLPNGKVAHKAKVCQQGGKALMTEKNIELGRWLISVIDPTSKVDEFGLPPKRRNPFTYENLVAIGSDSVVITRKNVGKTVNYAAAFGPLGSFEDFMEI
jgi:hypothetical protein